MNLTPDQAEFVQGLSESYNEALKGLAPGASERLELELSRICHPVLFRINSTNKNSQAWGTLLCLGVLNKLVPVMLKAANEEIDE